MRREKGITLVTLIVTVIVMLIIAGVAISLTIGENGIFKKSEQSIGIHSKQEATEKINMKITSSQMHTYTQEQRMPTLQELADTFCEDEEMEYVVLESKRTASIEKIEIGEAQSFFTKLKAYPYEFEIDRSLKLASINGIKLAENNTSNPDVLAKLEQMESAIQTLQAKNEELEKKVEQFNTNKYKLLGSVQGKNILNLDYTGYQAINIVTVVPNNGEFLFYSTIVPVSQLDSTKVQWFSAGTNNSCCWWKFSNGSIFVNQLSISTGEISANSTTHVYGI